MIPAESPATYQAWRQLLADYNVEGVAVHDARLVAMMQTAGSNHILSLTAPSLSVCYDRNTSKT